MKKIIVLYFVILTFGIVNSVNANMYTDSGKTCVVSTLSRKEFWFCGRHSESCAGRKMRKRHPRHWLEHGQFAIYVANAMSYSFDDEKIYYCCINDDGTGYFKPQDKWLWDKITKDYKYNDKEFNEYNTTETVTRQVQGGTCTYVRTVDMCGKPVLDIPCTEPDNCGDGMFLRNGRCVKPCDAGMAFENNESNNCIRCESNQAQGISAEGICIKCNFPQEMFDISSKKCKESIAIDRLSMKRCFSCPNNEYFKICTVLFGMSESDRIKDADWALIKKECYLK